MCIRDRHCRVDACLDDRNRLGIGEANVLCCDDEQAAAGGEQIARSEQPSEVVERRRCV